MSLKKIKFGDKEVDKTEFYSSKQPISLDSCDSLDSISCANLINNIYDYDNYDHLAIKLCSEFIMPIINITKKEHIKEYNEHIKDIIDNLESIKDIYRICSYLMNIYFEYLEIKKFIDHNIDITESALAPMIEIDYFNSCKKCYSHYYCS